MLPLPEQPLDPVMPMPGFAATVPVDNPLDLFMDDLRAEVERIEAEVEKENQPVYPSWLKMTGSGLKAKPVDYPRPNPEETLTHAKAIFQHYGGLRERFASDIRFLNGQENKVFADADQDEKDSAYIETMVQSEHELIVANLGAIEPIYQPEIRRRADADEAMDKADFLYAADAEMERRHIMGGNGPYRPDVVRTELMYGRIVAQIMYKTDCEEGEIPIRENLIDPATCAPIFDGDRGLEIMVRQYQTSLADARAAFNYDRKFREKLTKHKDRNFVWNDFTSCEVVEWWDRWWRIVWVDSCLIIEPTEHKLGEPPFIYQMGALGLPGFVRADGTYQKTALGTTVTHGYSTYDAALPNKGLSHVHIWRLPVGLREALNSRMLTQFRRSVDTAWLVEQDAIADDKGVPEISRKPNAVNTILKDRESVTALPMESDPASYGALMQLVNDQIGRAGAPVSAYGIGDNGNGSGFAIENLNESGRDKFMPHLVTLQMFYQQLAERRLKLLRDWGWMMKQGEEKRGKLHVSRPKPLPYQEPEFVLTPGDIRRTGYRCKVRMTKVRMSSLSQVMNAIAIMRNTQVGNPIYYYELLGHPNPERAVLEDKFHRMMADPVLERIELIEYLRKNGDEEKARLLESQTAPPDGGGMMPTDQLSAGASMQEPVSIQGASMPQFNQPPGPVR